MLHCNGRALSDNFCYEARQWESLAAVPGISVCCIPLRSAGLPSYKLHLILLRAMLDRLYRFTKVRSQK
ncbi:MAG: hypothetical protein F6K18_21040 [Okeania sp. SIO2C2]|uniref:hypothetical protein n=1 Tax=Okeania sp. SIO2C2 TaxID=2607787 RepID=UPI0013BB9F15|nr:hypothetical protein [Okeania sp. SIO2C2]NEP89114.1 hypothetical protein [Okeania sp. SIO2C2]